MDLAMSRIGTSLAVVAALGAAPAAANTVLEFADLLDGYEYFFNPAYEEDGYRLSTSYGTHKASDTLARFGEEAVHLEVCCGPFASSMFIQKNDFGAFGASAFDVLGDPTQTYLYSLTDRFGNSFTEAQALPIQIEASGYLGGSVVATQMFSAAVTTFDLSAAFGNIDALQLSVSGAATSSLPQDAQWDLTDVMLDIDNIQVGAAAAVTSMPIPAGAVLLLSALGGMALTRRRRAV